MYEESILTTSVTFQILKMTKLIIELHIFRYGICY